jgi:hypothetical protein
MRFSSQYASAHLSPTFPHHGDRPLAQGESPMASHQNTTEYIHNFNHESQEAISAFLDCKQHWLNIVFKEYPWDRLLVDAVGLLGNGVLVGENAIAGVVTATIDCVDGWDNGEEVLEFVEVVWSCGHRAIEGVEEGGVEGTEGEFVDDMREVEG